MAIPHRTVDDIIGSAAVCSQFFKIDAVLKNQVIADPIPGSFGAISLCRQ